MMSYRLFSKFKIASILFTAAILFCQSAVFAQDTDRKFDSVDLLASTLGIDVVANEAAIADLTAINDGKLAEISANDLLIADLEAQILLGDPTGALQLELDALLAANGILNADILANETEIAVLQKPLDFLNALSPEQLFALNRSLNNAVKSGLIINYDLDLLQRIIDEDLDNRQIHFLTKALELEAKFLQIYARTGNPVFLDKAAYARAKFLAKIDNTGAPSDVGGNLADEEARLAAKEARDLAREAGKEAAKEARELAKEARQLARDEASDARTDAKEAAKIARELAKEALDKGNSAAAHAAHKP